MSEPNLPEGLEGRELEPIGHHELPQVEAPVNQQSTQMDREASMHETVMNQRGAAVPEGYESHDQHFRHQMGWIEDPRVATPGEVEPTGDVEIPAPVEDVPDDAELKIEDPGTKPDAVSDGEWNQWGQEIDNTGELSDGTRDAIKAKYQIDDTVIDMFLEGRKASVKKQYAAAAETVGGMDNLNDMLKWASLNYGEAQREQLNAALLGPQAEFVLKGIAADYSKANTAATAKAKEPKAKGTQVNNPVNGTDPTPFAHKAEMYAAMNDPRYRTDESYRNIVAAKMNATYASRGGRFW